MEKIPGGIAHILGTIRFMQQRERFTAPVTQPEIPASVVENEPVDASYLAEATTYEIDPKPEDYRQTVITARALKLAKLSFSLLAKVADSIQARVQIRKFHMPMKPGWRNNPSVSEIEDKKGYRTYQDRGEELVVNQLSSSVSNAQSEGKIIPLSSLVIQEDQTEPKKMDLLEGLNVTANASPQLPQTSEVPENVIDLESARARFINPSTTVQYTSNVADKKAA